MAIYLWLKVTSQKQIMKDFGFYDGPVDSKKDDARKKAILKVNKKYLPKRFHDEVYYKETDIVLKNLRRFKESGVTNFKLEEFKCGCGRRYCSGYPAVLSANLLKNLQNLRDEIGPMTISSGLRCQEYNDSLPGSISNSQHLLGLAADFYGPGTDTVGERKRIVREWLKKPYANYAYSDTPNMNEAVHVQCKK